MSIPGGETLEDRIKRLAKTYRECPVGMVVADEAERQAAKTIIAATRGAKMITVETRAEFEASRPAHLQERH